MTRGEAIGLIESARKTMYLPKSKEYISDFGYALEMAIKALEQKPCNADTCKVVKAYMNEWDKPNNKDIIQLPPVNPQPKTGHTMQIVIDIPEDDYRRVQDGRASVAMMRNAIRNGTPLPKGHGALKDTDKIRIVRTPGSAVDENTEIIICAIKQYINQLPTIIEADRAESEE